MKIETNTWDPMLVTILANKLDSVTLREWEYYEKINEIPTITEFHKFLKFKCEKLEKLHNKIESKPIINNKKGKTQANVSTDKTIQCFYCRGSHSIYYCEQFLKLSSNNRLKEVQSMKLCVNCLRPNHNAKKLSIIWMQKMSKKA